MGYFDLFPHLDARCSQCGCLLDSDLPERYAYRDDEDALRLFCLDPHHEGENLVGVEMPNGSLECVCCESCARGETIRYENEDDDEPHRRYWLPYVDPRRESHPRRRRRRNPPR